VVNLVPIRETEPLFDGQGRGTRRLNEYLRLLTAQVNTTSDETEEINTQLSSNQQIISQLAELLKKEEIIVPTTTSSGVKAFETHICKNTAPITKTLDVNALEGDIVTIKRRDAKVTIIGTINGRTDLVINRKQSAPKLAFDGFDWSTV